jgi:ferric-dicitrate binding protein FerR (iron transport regulator)
MLSRNSQVSLAILLIIVLGGTGYFFLVRKGSETGDVTSNVEGAMQAGFSEVSGSVTLIGKTDSHRAQKGERIQTGDHISTGRNGQAVIRLSSGARIALKERTEVIFDEITIPEGGAGRIRARLVTGEVWSQVAATAPTELSLSSPTLITRSQGGSYLFKATTEQESVHVFSGNVDVKAGKLLTLHEGQEMVLEVKNIPSDLESAVKTISNVTRDDAWVISQLQQDAEFIK